MEEGGVSGVNVAAPPLDHAEAAAGGQDSRVLCYEHPCVDFVRFLLLSGGFQDDDDDRATICPCRTCKPPGWIARIIEKYFLRSSSEKVRSSSSSSLVCVNGKHFLEWGAAGGGGGAAKRKEGINYSNSVKIGSSGLRV